MGSPGGWRLRLEITLIVMLVDAKIRCHAGMPARIVLEDFVGQLRERNVSTALRRWRRNNQARAPLAGSMLTAPGRFRIELSIAWDGSEVVSLAEARRRIRGIGKGELQAVNASRRSPRSIDDSNSCRVVGATT